jgi:glycosyltransferase involved in cell wall biosynthesis
MDYICDAIDSILKQENNFETEIVFVDDASKDKTFELASSRLKGIKGVQLIKNSVNLGITKNYQKGFRLCSGKYVFVLEGDDYWTDTSKVKRQVDFLEEHRECSMCFHPFLTRKRSPKEFYNQFQNLGNNEFDLFGINDMILNEGLIANFSVCCYRKVFLNQLPDALFETVSYDWMVNIAMAEFGLLGRINRSMSVYRLSETGVWSNKSTQKQIAEIIKLIPAYDAVLEYRHTNVFQQKKTMFENAIRELEKSPSGSPRFVPAFVLPFIKGLTPPALKKLLKRL